MSLAGTSAEAEPPTVNQLHNQATKLLLQKQTAADSGNKAIYN